MPLARAPAPAPAPAPPPPRHRLPDGNGNPLDDLDTTLSLFFNSNLSSRSDSGLATESTLDLDMLVSQEATDHVVTQGLIDNFASVSPSELHVNEDDVSGSVAAQNTLDPDSDPSSIDLSLSLSVGSSRRSASRGNGWGDFIEMEDSMVGFDWGSLIHYESEALGFPSLEDLIRSQRNTEWEELCEYFDSLFEEPVDFQTHGPFEWSLDGFIESVGYQSGSSERGERENGILPAAKKVVESLPLVELRDVEVVCAVCGEEVVEGEKVNRLPCKHYYHGGCILPWLKIRNTCPLCRYELPVEGEEQDNRSKRRRIV